MKCSVRVKRINGVEYLYEDTPYYDREKKQIRHRSRYLGKNVDGEPKKVRSRMPHSTYSYGELLPFLDILKELDIERHLDMLDERDRNMVFAIAINRVCRPLAMNNLHYWYQSSYLSLIYPVEDFSGRHPGELLHRIGDSNLASRIHARLLKGWGTEHALIYDMTGLAGRPGNEDLSACGYCSDGQELSPLSLSIIIDTARGTPVMYDLYPGSIADTGKFEKTLKRLQADGVDDCALVLGDEFFSVSNIEELCIVCPSFIIPASRRLKGVRELLSSVQRSIDRPEFLRQYGKNPLYVHPVALQVGDREIKGYCYYDPRREQVERKNFDACLKDTLEKLRKTKVSEWRNAEDVFKENAGHMYNFFLWEKKRDGFRVEIRNNAVSQYVNRLGKFILLYQGNADWQECLTVYREKDIVEQAFLALKGDAEASSLNMQKEETARGLLFVGFVSLILRMRLLRRMKEAGLLEHYTVDSLLLELENIKKIKLDDGTFITTELTRKQKYILRRLRLSA